MWIAIPVLHHQSLVLRIVIANILLFCTFSGFATECDSKLIRVPAVHRIRILCRSASQQFVADKRYHSASKDDNNICIALQRVKDWLLQRLDKERYCMPVHVCHWVLMTSSPIPTEMIDWWCSNELGVGLHHLLQSAVGLYRIWRFG